MDYVTSSPRGRSSALTAPPTPPVFLPTMWCTRWYLPLLLLPLPTAPPYFLILFLLSLTLHAKPCFYCIVLLTTLFLSSCYWQPFPLDTPLSVPWAENITTFAEALNSTLPANYTGPIPTVMRAADRCWCELKGGRLFVPFNVSDWERTSVLRLRNELESRQQTAAKQEVLDALAGTLNETSVTPANLSSTTNTTATHFPPFRLPRITLASLRNLLSPQGRGNTQDSTSDSDSSAPTTSTSEDEASSKASPKSYVASGRELDLRPYGIDLILDYDWSRS